jgi:glycosyltransferase involved in cell wall biosynthesis
MRILHIIDSAGLYGAEVMLLNLAEEQTRLGHQPVIASIREKHESELQLEDEARRRGLEVITFRMLDGPNFFGAWRILSYAWANHFDVMHAHGYKGDILFGFIPKSIRRIPLVSTLHGWTNNNHLSKILLYEYLDSLTLKYMDAVCPVNQAMLEHPWLKNINGCLHVVPNGIPSLENLEPFGEDEITEFCKQGFTIASIGRLSKEKGYEYLLEAFNLFQKDAQDGRLLIIGEGPERLALERSVKNKGLSGKVFLPGYRDKAHKYLQHCKIFVLSSLTEGFPITLLEAMQVGIPVVATSVGGIPQVIIHEETGFLVPPKSHDAINHVLKRIYRNDQHDLRMVYRAKRRVMSEFSSIKMAERYIELYGKVKAR